MNRLIKISFLFILLFFNVFHVKANINYFQKIDSAISSPKNKKVDSVLQRFADSTKVGFWIYKNLYEQPTKDDGEIARTYSGNNKDNLYRFHGKIIRNIYIKQLDPFGTDVNDTLIKKYGTIENLGNKINISSREGNIKNQLLFKKGDTLDALTLRESERLLRRQEYIRDSRIIVPANTKKNADSVDVIVIVQDRWSINASAGVSTTASDFKLTESNFLGTGTRIVQGGNYNFEKMKFTDWSGELKDINIKNTYIDGSVFYNIRPDMRWHGVNFERTFYSPLTKWAGSAGITRYIQNLEYDLFKDGSIIPATLSYNVADFWLGRSLAISKRNIAGRSTSFILGSRYVNTKFFERPSLNLDTNNSYQDRQMLLFNLGISTRRYYKDKKIFRFGNTEDVPEGRSFTVIGGYYNEGVEDYIYNALKFSAGQNVEGIGYFSGAVQYGVFFNNYIASRGVLNLDLSYFSNLLTRGRWNMRQFIYLQATNGLNRIAGEHITLNGRGNGGLYGFNSFAVMGQNKSLLKFESIIYTPFNYAGIQVAAVVFAGFGKIGRQSPMYSYINENTIYQAYGLGFLIRKENLVVNTIQISFAYYPNLPDGTGNQIRYNPIGINNLNLRDFDVTKPDFVNYR